ncbi:MAG: hypothetical protein Q4G44_11085 [Alcaligenaceae bacterium]|nr:hypothetical protein [Alcaligenaceae bacterium]
MLVEWRKLPSVMVADNDAEVREQALLQDNAVLNAVLVERLNIRLTESIKTKVEGT